RASAKATCPWCHGTLHGAAFSSRGFVPPDVAGFLGWEATAPGTCQLLLRSRKPASAPDGELRALHRLAERRRGRALRWSPARALRVRGGRPLRAHLVQRAARADPEGAFWASGSAGRRASQLRPARPSVTAWRRGFRIAVVAR